jgi:hypothetical protein
MKFFVLGDSWGVGEWKKINGQLESVPNTGIDYYLATQGHTVTNISAGSAGNFGQLRRAYWTLHDHSDYDYIIWFHTEAMRDIQEILINDPDEGRRQYPEFDSSNFDRGIEYIHLQNYCYAQKITNQYNIPFIVIAGQSSLNKQLQQFSFAQFTINWLKELLELDYDPPENTFYSWQKLEKIFKTYNIDSRQYIIDHFDELEKTQQILQLAKNNKKFPCGGHPSRQCFEQLANRIIEITSYAGQL